MIEMLYRHYGQMMNSWNISMPSLFKITKTIVASSLFSLFIVACSGGDSAEPAPINPVLPPVVFTNDLVSCGAINVTPPVTLPWVLSRPSDWVVMGSSSAFGAGASLPTKSWAGLLQTEYRGQGVTVHNIAKGGYTTYHALAADCVVAANRPKTDLNHNINKALEYKPDVVFISFPTNDAVSGFKVMESASNILLLRSQLMKQGSAVVVLSAQPRNTNASAQQAIAELDQLLRPVIGGCYVDVFALLVSVNGGLSPSYDAGDGVHLNDAGHQIVATEISKLVSSKRCISY